MDRESFLKIALAAVVASVIAWVYASGAYEWARLSSQRPADLEPD